MRGSDIENYITQLYKSQETDLMKQVNQRLLADGALKKSIGLTEGLVLKFLSSMPGVEKVVEIGVLYGYSALWVLEGLNKNYCFYALERDENCLKESQKTFELLPEDMAKPILMPGDAAKILPSLSKEGPFDLIFIDANKSKYLEYYQWACDNLRVGGFMAIDNTFLFGTVWQDPKPESVPEKMWKVMRQLNRDVVDNRLFTSCMIPTAEGLTVLRKN